MRSICYQEFFRSVLEMQRYSTREQGSGPVSVHPVEKSGSDSNLPTKKKGSAVTAPKETVRSSNFDPIKIDSIGVKASTATNKRNQIVVPTASTLASKEETILASTVLQSDDDQIRAPVSYTHLTLPTE